MSALAPPLAENIDIRVCLEYNAGNQSDLASHRQVNEWERALYQEASRSLGRSATPRGTQFPSQTPQPALHTPQDHAKEHAAPAMSPQSFAQQAREKANAAAAL